MSTRTTALLLAGAGLILSTTACSGGPGAPAAATTTAPATSAPATATPSRSSATAGATGAPAGSTTSAGSVAPVAQQRFADEGAFPFQVSFLNLKATDDADKPATDDLGRHFCGGSLLDERHVLTAAHCITTEASENPPDPRRDFRVVVGRTTLTSSQGQVRRIARYQVHPLYSRNPPGYDVAVITLDKPVTGIAPVTLVPPGDTSLQRVGSLLTYTGWGSNKTHRDNESSHPFTDRMKEARVPMMAGEACRSAYRKHPYQSPPDLRVSLCTSTTDGIGHCYGDSGGPLFATDGGRVVQLGVVSFAAGCGDPRYPSVYVRLNKGDINAFIREAAGSDG